MKDNKLNYIINKMSASIFDISRVVYVYSRVGKVKCLNHAEALECHALMISDKWKHTSTLDGPKWIEHLCNNATSSEVTNVKINELRGVV